MAKTKKKKTPPKKKKRSQKKQKRSFLFWSLKWIFIFGLWAGIFLGGVVIWYAKDLQEVTKSASFERRSSIIVKDREGEVLARYGETKGDNLSVEDVPDYLVQAVLATEDRRFYNHPGVDLQGIARAMAINLMKGRFVQGGSTITQQLAKNLFLTHDRKLARKVKEALLAFWLEHELTKDEILSAYMNRVYLGSGTYGFDAASRLYFGKSAKDVNLREAAILAGLLKAPSKYSPHNNLDLAKERSEVVLKSMKDAGYITDRDINEENMSVSLPHQTSSTEQNTRYFADWVLDGMEELVGRPDMDLIIETTIDLALHKQAERSLKERIDNAREEHFVSQGAVLVMSPDGAILTMLGGYDYSQSQFNRATQAYRAPGSSFKPIVYLTALQNGWKTTDEILDAPITEGEYRPQNFAEKYYGTVTLEQALAKSMNTATVRLAQNIGISPILSTARNLGIISKLEPDLSLSLGSSGISMLEMGLAYAVIANGGYRVFPYGITRITEHNGNVLYERKEPKSFQAIVRPEYVHALSDMMETVIKEGTGRRAQLPFNASGKTGTSQDNRDAWFVGFTNKTVAIVWLGNDDNSPMTNITGGSLPAEIWQNVMLLGNVRHSSVRLSGSFFNGDGGISGLLGRILTGGNTATHNTQKEGDFSNLND